MTIHCAKCKNPWTGCGNKDCRCHQGSDAELLDYLTRKADE